MSELYGKVGFASPDTNSKFVKRRRATIQLIATAALVVSLIVAVTAVSIGAARAQMLGAVAQNRAFVALVMAGVGGTGGLTALAARSRTIGRDL